jgi:hypothetical protein
MNVTVEKVVLNEERNVPLIAALPFRIRAEESATDVIRYDPATQRSAMGRNYSTCRYDESAGGIFSSKSDTSKDD